MYTYTLAFVYYNDQFLMLNRIKQPWLGMWNGLGGKIKIGETPLKSIKRELSEEMNESLDHASIIDVGVLTWNDFDAEGQGIHLFKVNLNKPFEMTYPIATREGVLDLKPLDWIINPNNLGVATNIKYFLKEILESPKRVHCEFSSGILVKVTVNPL
jgi:8-oxo-dGTP diphosphatase